ncbi:MAG: hypothetical protein KAG89_14180, partial [Fulvimarina manganoxydans]|uniref:hypothetical protein n=1 Tax=Fulvimarina manganoxydans TaxID=937218 RepID=UPI002357DFAD
MQRHPLPLVPAIATLIASLGSVGPASATGENYAPNSSHDPRIVLFALTFEPAGPNRGKVVVSVQNKWDQPLDVTFDCRVFGNGTQPRTVFGIARSIAPHRHRLESSTPFPAGPNDAACRVRKVESPR